MSLGDKWNFGAEQARGSILAQWPDDDWFYPARIVNQATPILRNEAGITGLRTETVWDLFGGGAWPCEADFDRRLFGIDLNPQTLIFERRIWEQLGGYPSLDENPALAFLSLALGAGERLRSISGVDCFIYVPHEEKTPRCKLQRNDGSNCSSVPEMTEEHREFYQTLRASLPDDSDPMRPLVSCIMPTADRRPLARLAIQHFLNQDYARRELLVVDDGADPIADLIPADPRVRYIRLNKRGAVGAKRNFACAQARGSLIAHWDDDDWMAPWRLSYQVGEILRSGADICGLDRVLFWDPVGGRLWEYVYPAAERPWVAGGTMLYRKSFWAGNPFHEIAVGEDNLFVWNASPDKVLRLRDQRYYVATVHGNNTSPKFIADERWRAQPAAELQSLMGAEREEYAELFLAAHRAAQSQVAQSAPPAPRRTRHRSTARVSCVMATTGRFRFVRQATRCFLRQTYLNAELIIVDESTPGVEDLCSGIRSVRYLRAPAGTSLGAKLNLGVEQAQGTIIQKIDDDDFYGREFLECAVTSLEDSAAARALVAWDCFLVLLAGDPRIRFSGHGWAAGGSLCFHRELWTKAKFRNIPNAVDAAFLADTNAEIRRICAAHLYLVIRHGRNTWVRDNNGQSVDDAFRDAPDSGIGIRQLTEPIDYPFYEALMRGEVAYE
jgi:glycosyltransferase involved in cell wall biosynthesis